MIDTITQAAVASTEFHGPHVGGPWFLLFPLFWITVFVVIALIFKRRGGGHWARNHGAEGVLRERYARGEVSEEEYRQRLEILRQK